MCSILFFAIESGVCIGDSRTKKAYWAMPNSVKEVQYASVREISCIGNLLP